MMFSRAILTPLTPDPSPPEYRGRGEKCAITLAREVFAMSGPSNPWAPFEPTAADPWDRRKVAHLHRRAGFGVTWSELERDLRAGPAVSVSRLLNPPAPSADEQQVLDGLRGGIEISDERLK